MVCPALLPPWKRTTMSARFDSQSMILPLPSSPHWAPITVTLAMVYSVPGLNTPMGITGTVPIYSRKPGGVRAKVPHLGNAAPLRQKSVKHVVFDLDDLAAVL